MSTLHLLLLPLAVVGLACAADGEPSAASTPATVPVTTVPVTTVPVTTVPVPTVPATTAPVTTQPGTTGPSVDGELTAEIDDSCEGGFLLALDGTAVTGQPEVELAVDCPEGVRNVVSNGMISFEFVPITPNELAEQAYDIDLAISPELAAEHGAMGLGMVGVSVDGVAIFAAFEAPRDDYRDPKTDGLLDDCNGHTGPGGQYHYHALPTCLFDDVAVPGTIVGYALDGYPILAPYAYDSVGNVVEVHSSYEYVGQDGDINAFEDWEYVDGLGDLDECNAMQLGDGSWAYFATDEFPWGPFCFIGVTDAAQGTFAGEPPAGG